MRTLRAFLAASALLLAPAPAPAALLSLLGSSTLEFRGGAFGGDRTVTYLPGLCQVTFPGLSFPMNQPGVPVSLLPGGGFVEPSGIFTGTQSRKIPGIIFTVTPSGGFCSGTAFPVFAGTTIASVSNGTKSIAPGAPAAGRTTGVLRPGGALGGPGPLAGTFIVNVLGLFNLDVPLSPVGATGATGQVVAGTFAVTVLGTGWTTGPVQITGITTPTPGGGAVNTVTFAGYDNRTPGHVGRVVLVSPFKVITNAAGNLPGVARQTLDFAGAVPEPGVLALLAAGAAALALQGRRRLRRR